MYTAEIISVEKEDTQPLPTLNVTVQYSKDNVVMDLPDLKPIRTSNPDDIKVLIAQQIATFEKSDAIKAVADNPNIGSVDLSNPVVQPTDRDIYFKNVEISRELKRAIDAGASSMQSDYDAVIKLIDSQYNKSYYGL